MAKDDSCEPAFYRKSHRAADSTVLLPQGYKIPTIRQKPNTPRRVRDMPIRVGCFIAPD